MKTINWLNMVGVSCIGPPFFLLIDWTWEINSKLVISVDSDVVNHNQLYTQLYIWL